MEDPSKYRWHILDSMAYKRKEVVKLGEGLRDGSGRSEGEKDMKRTKGHCLWYEILKSK